LYPASKLETPGNSAEDSSKYFPGNCAGVISIGASTNTGALASYSNTAADVAAPGGDISNPIVTMSLDAQRSIVPVNAMGTSLATPLVAGFLAIAFATYGPTFNIGDTLTPFTGACTAEVCGAGIVSFFGKAHSKIVTSPDSLPDNVMYMCSPSAVPSSNGTMVDVTMSLNTSTALWETRQVECSSTIKEEVVNVYGVSYAVSWYTNSVCSVGFTYGPISNRQEPLHQCDVLDVESSCALTSSSEDLTDPNNGLALVTDRLQNEGNGFFSEIVVDEPQWLRMDLGESKHVALIMLYAPNTFTGTAKPWIYEYVMIGDNPDGPLEPGNMRCGDDNTQVGSADGTYNYLQCRVPNYLWYVHGRYVYLVQTVPGLLVAATEIFVGGGCIDPVATNPGNFFIHVYCPLGTIRELPEVSVADKLYPNPMADHMYDITKQCGADGAGFCPVEFRGTRNAAYFVTLAQLQAGALTSYERWHSGGYASEVITEELVGTVWIRYDLERVRDDIVAFEVTGPVKWSKQNTGAFFSVGTNPDGPLAEGNSQCGPALPVDYFYKYSPNRDPGRTFLVECGRAMEGRYVFFAQDTVGSTLWAYGFAVGGGCMPTVLGEAGPCGNGVQNIGEQCDDGNFLDNDGCSHTCQLEDTVGSVWLCTTGADIKTQCCRTLTNPVDGSSVCTCEGIPLPDGVGYTLLPNCEKRDVDECNQMNGGCHAEAECLNVDGRSGDVFRNCVCAPGWNGDGVTSCSLRKYVTSFGVQVEDANNISAIVVLQDLQATGTLPASVTVEDISIVVNQ
jgi:cysteine-rich repeat protein